MLDLIVFAVERVDIMMLIPSVSHWFSVFWEVQFAGFEVFLTKNKKIPEITADRVQNTVHFSKNHFSLGCL